jgi:hypothetical protein
MLLVFWIIRKMVRKILRKKKLSMSEREIYTHNAEQIGPEKIRPSIFLSIVLVAVRETSGGATKSSVYLTTGVWLERQMFQPSCFQVCLQDIVIGC